MGAGWVRRGWWAITAGVIAVAASGAPSAVAAGPEPAEADPDAIVSSDGSRPPLAPAGAGGRSAAGSGERAEAVAGPGPAPRPGYPPGRAGATSIIDSDDRVRVWNTTAFPARAVALVESAEGVLCTGFLIGPDTVATAGHCVHFGRGGGFLTGVRVYPGRDRDRLPYGSCGARRLYTVAAWARRSSPAHDYGAVKLDCRVGERTGWFGFIAAGAADLQGLPTTINGYPFDKFITGGFTQWRSRDFVRDVSAHQVLYANDTVGGMSGGPVYTSRQGCGQCALAVHAYGVDPSAAEPLNSGTRVTRAVARNLATWRDAPA